MARRRRLGVGGLAERSASPPRASLLATSRRPAHKLSARLAHNTRYMAYAPAGAAAGMSDTPDVPPAFSTERGGNVSVGQVRAARGGDWLLPFGIGLAAFVVYLTTLSRGVLGGDAGELQFVPPILGLTHPTGYPLQVMLHYAWSFVPIGSVAYRLNLLDAGFAAAAVGVVVALARSLGAGRAGGALAGLSLAFGELWWSQAVRGDKYTLNGLFLALVLLLFVRWRACPTPGRLLWLAGVFGVSLTHHRSMLLVVPALLVGLVLSRWRPRSVRELLTLGVLVLTPLLLYAYVPWAGARGLPPGSWPVDSPSAFFEFLLDRGYTSALRPDEAFRGRLLEEAWVLVRSFGPLGALLGVVGLVALVVRNRVNGIVLVLAFAPQAILGASYLLESNYQLPRHWVFFLPGFLIWSVWVGLGFDAALGWVTRRLSGFESVARFGRYVPAAVLALCYWCKRARPGRAARSCWFAARPARRRWTPGGRTSSGRRWPSGSGGWPSRWLCLKASSCVTGSKRRCSGISNASRVCGQT